MDTSHDTSTTQPTATPATPFPTTGAEPRTVNRAADVPPEAAASTPLVDGLLRRATQGAHDVIDGLAAKASAVASGAQDKVDHVTDTRDAWIESARDAIRQHPFLAVGGALLVGAALLSLNSSRDAR